MTLPFDFNRWQRDLRARQPGLARALPGIVCADGLHLSVQASSYHYCAPRVDRSPNYTAVEVLAWGGEDPLLDRYRSLADQGVCPWMSVGDLNRVVANHGGMVGTYTDAVPATAWRRDTVCNSPVTQEPK